MKKTSFGCLLGIAIFWCGLVGVFLGFIGIGILRHLDAQRRFLVTDGTVLESRVVTSRGSKGSTLYRPKIRYRYDVKGREYVSDQFTFDTSSSSGGRDYSDRMVATNPPGREIRVYYDPDRPEVAILELRVPTLLWFMLFFLQPFLTIGIALVAGIVSYFPRGRRIEHFLATPPSFPWKIPSWGTMKSSDGVLSIEYRPSRVGMIVGAWAVATFLLTFVGAFGFMGFPDPPRWGVGALFGTAAMIAIVGGLFSAVRMRKRITLDPKARILEIESAKGTRMISGKEIAEFLIHRPPVRTKYGTKPGSPKLCAILRDGSQVDLHKFGSTDECGAIAHKIGEFLADSIAVPLQARY
jgi:hypothetical protein